MALLLCNGPTNPEPSLNLFRCRKRNILYVYTAKTAKFKLSIAETHAFIFVCQSLLKTLKTS